MDVFFLCPGRVLVCVFYISGSEQTKNLPGKNPLSLLEPCAVILNLALECQYFFLSFFRYRLAQVSQPAMPIQSARARFRGGLGYRRQAGLETGHIADLPFALVSRFR